MTTIALLALLLLAGSVSAYPNKFADISACTAQPTQAYRPHQGPVTDRCVGAGRHGVWDRHTPARTPARSPGLGGVAYVGQDRPITILKQPLAMCA